MGIQKLVLGVFTTDFHTVRSNVSVDFTSSYMHLMVTGVSLFQKRYYKVFKVQNVDLYYLKVIQNMLISFLSFNNNAYEKSNEYLLSIHERVRL